MIWPVVTGLQLCHLAMSVLAAGQIHRAAYQCDQLTVPVAGTAATVALYDLTAAGEGAWTAVSSRARAGVAMPEWGDLAGSVLESTAERRTVLRQLSVRQDSSLFGAIPPAGRRARLLESQRSRPARVSITEAEAADIDRELDRFHERCRRVVATTG